MNAYWEKALETSLEAEQLLEARRYDGAASRAYYAMFNAVRAFLNEHAGLDVSDIRRHSAVFRLFSLHGVRTGLIEPDLNRAINEAFELRAIADYDQTRVSASEAADVVSLMSRMLEAIRAFIESDSKT